MKSWRVNVEGFSTECSILVIHAPLSALIAASVGGRERERKRESERETEKEKKEEREKERERQRERERE